MTVFAQQPALILQCSPRKRRTPERYKIGSGQTSHSATVKEHYHCQYCEALDIAVASIMTQFDQPGYAMYKSLESLLVQAANGQKYDQQLDNVTALDKADFDRALLSTQLQNLGKWFADREPKKMGTVSFAECVAFLQASHSCRSPFSVTFVDFRSWSWSCQLQTQLVNVVFQPLGISKPTYTAPRARAG